MIGAAGATGNGVLVVTASVKPNSASIGSCTSKSSEGMEPSQLTNAKIAACAPSEPTTPNNVAIRRDVLALCVGRLVMAAGTLTARASARCMPVDGLGAS